MGLLKRLSELGGNQQGEIGVGRVQLGIEIAVAIDHRNAAVIVFLADQSTGIHTERAHLVLERYRRNTPSWLRKGAW